MSSTPAFAKPADGAQGRGLFQFAYARSRDLAGEEARQQARIVAQRQRLMEAERKCELLAKLRERQHEAWRQEETKQLEELASDVFLAAWNQRRR